MPPSVPLKRLLTGLGWLLSLCPLLAQPPSQLRLLVQDYLQRSPSLKARQYETAAARQQSRILKTARLPTLDATAQANVATYNNLTGMFYPTGILPISGPPSTGNNFSPVTGTALGGLLNWSPFTFGALDSRLAVAEAELNARLAEETDEQLRIQVATAGAYLDALLGQELVKITAQNTARVDSLLRQVKALVVQGLRPEVDTALTVTELSRAETEQINARAQAEAARIRLAEWLARPDTALILTDTLLLTRTPASATAPTDGPHPTERIFQSRISVETARIDQIRHQYRPKLTFWGTAYARGSGIDYRGDVQFADGLLFSRYNYGAGVHLAWPLLRGAERSALLTQQDFRIRAAAEQLAQTQLTLGSQRRSATLLRQQAEAVARQLPRQVAAARQALTGLELRYRSGLVNLTDVLQAQYTLLRAETDQKAAVLAVWRSLLLESYATGTLTPFLQAL
ncbi:TolC family protein [Larkinella sp. VNQ87]|uniref:TolC family protein n=1 Tax=Larkinella sp. VNQ87 TaxID=3400921 RepID=UPI003C1139B5